MLADLLLAYLCIGLATAFIAGVRLVRRLATHRTPERRDMLRALHESGLPHGLAGLMFGLAMLVLLLEVGVFWPSRLENLLRGGW